MPGTGQYFRNRLFIQPEASAVGGVDSRQYSFGSNFVVDRIRQISLPVGVAVPVGQRFSFDVGSSYAVTSVKDATGSRSFSGFTDTQIRGSYVFGNDAFVASLMVNLPTGKETTTIGNFGIASAASANFLLFPVNSYGSGFSVTPGLAMATTAGTTCGSCGRLGWRGGRCPVRHLGINTTNRRSLAPGGLEETTV